MLFDLEIRNRAQSFYYFGRSLSRVPKFAPGHLLIPRSFQGSTDFPQNKFPLGVNKEMLSFNDMDSGFTRG